MDREQLRKIYKQKRTEISEKDNQIQSEQIARQVCSLPIWDKQYYHIFLPIKKKNEVNTHYIKKYLEEKQKKIVVSKTLFETNQMQHYLLNQQTQLVLNRWGIPEPVDGKMIASNQIEVVFIPLLAFDVYGNRLGYGKGYYDRFLKECSPHILKIGLSFFAAENQKINTLPTDIPLNYCVTPQKIYTFASEFKLTNYDISF